MTKGVANGLRELRQHYGLTQEQLARDLDVTRHTILALEVGRYVPSIELALKLAAYFGQPLETIFWLPEEEIAQLRSLGQGSLRDAPAAHIGVSASVAPASPPANAGAEE